MQSPWEAALLRKELVREAGKDRRITEANFLGLGGVSKNGKVIWKQTHGFV